MPDLNAAGPPNAPRLRARPPFRGVPLRILLPNLVTLLALCLGLTAIRFAFETRFEIAVIFVATAAVLDGLDGRIARALKGTTRFGAELDSLADFVDFGVAPAMILYFSSLYQIKSLGWLAAMLFAVAAALRLARFNIMLDDPDKPAWAASFFSGMPTPAGAIVGLLPAYLHALGVPIDVRLVPLEVAYLLLIAFLMASRIPHFSGKHIGRVPRDLVLPVLLGVLLLILLLATYPVEMLVAITLAYLASIPFGARAYRRLARAEAAGLRPDQPPGSAEPEPAAADAAPP